MSTDVSQEQKQQQQQQEQQQQQLRRRHPQTHSDEKPLQNKIKQETYFSITLFCGIVFFAFAICLYVTIAKFSIFAARRTHLPPHPTFPSYSESNADIAIKWIVVLLDQQDHHFDLLNMVGELNRLYGLYDMVDHEIFLVDSNRNIRWMVKLREFFDNFVFGDFHCHQRLICDLMKEPELYKANKLEDLLQFARYLEIIVLPDNVRDMLDAYLEAGMISKTSETCDERFKCPYSIIDSLQNESEVQFNSDGIINEIIARVGFAGFKINTVDFVSWVILMKDLFERLNYKGDLQCQKRLICDWFGEPDYYVAGDKVFKSASDLAKYFAGATLAEDIRTLAVEYLEAISHPGSCKEEFKCPYSTNRSRGSKDDHSDLSLVQTPYRSFTDGLTFKSMLYMMSDLYNYIDLDCQRRLICEVMKEPDYYGALAEALNETLQYAKYSELIILPDHVKELIDEYLDAGTRSKTCDEYFNCIYDTKKISKKYFKGNSKRFKNPNYSYAFMLSYGAFTIAVIAGALYLIIPILWL